MAGEGGARLQQRYVGCCCNNLQSVCGIKSVKQDAQPDLFMHRARFQATAVPQLVARICNTNQHLQLN